MKLSLCVPYYENRPEKRQMLRRCVESFTGYDELVLVWNDGAGFSKAVNMGFELAKGDYIAMVSDDCFLVSGDVRDLMVEGTVTSPKIHQNQAQAFSGVMWCFPRDLYEKYGMLDEGFTKGIYYEDEDLWMKLKTENIPHKCIESVVVSHPEGGATLIHDPNRGDKIEANKNYFLEKWGRLP